MPEWGLSVMFVALCGGLVAGSLWVGSKYENVKLLPRLRKVEKRSIADMKAIETLNVGQSAMFFGEYQHNGGEIILPGHYQ